MSDRRAPPDRPRSSRQRYRAFVQDYKKRRLDDPSGAGEDQKGTDDSSSPGENLTAEESRSKRRGKRREYLREYLRWLWPHRYAVAALLVVALVGAGLQMV